MYEDPREILYRLDELCQEWSDLAPDLNPTPLNTMLSEDLLGSRQFLVERVLEERQRAWYDVSDWLERLLAWLLSPAQGSKSGRNMVVGSPGTELEFAL